MHDRCWTLAVSFDLIATGPLWKASNTSMVFRQLGLAVELAAYFNRSFSVASNEQAHLENHRALPIYRLTPRR